MNATHVVALSGGKDSTAMALRLAEVESREYIYVCTPTGNELPEMFAHWRRLAVLLGQPIVPVVAHTLSGLIEKQGALPNWRQRWCTRLLKIEPFAAYLAALPSPVTSYVGLRADEPDREGGNYLKIPGVVMRFPLREWGWGLKQVRAYLAERCVEIPERTDCAVCFFQRLSEWYRLWLEHPGEYAQGEAWEAQTGHTFRSPGRDSQPTSLAMLRAKFEQGYVPKGAEPSLFREAQCRVCSL